MDQWNIDPAYHIEDYLIIKRPKEEDDKKPLLERTRKTCCDTCPVYLNFSFKKKKSFECPKSIRNYEKKK